MKVINKNTGFILDIQTPDFTRKTVNCTEQENRYEGKLSSVIHLPKNQTTTANVAALVTADFLAQNPDFILLADYNDWLHANCPERAYFSYAQITLLLQNCKPLVDAIYEDPINPVVEYPNGRLIYFYTVIPAENRAILDSYGVTIESKPV